MAALLAGGEDPPVRPLGIVLVDVAHRADPDGAQRVVDFMAARPDGFASLEEAADAVAAYVPHRPRPADVARLRRNLRERADGRLVWHWDPQLLVSMGDGHAALPDGARVLRAARAAGAPILVIRGALSDVLTEAIAVEFCAAVPGARRVDVDDAAHMVAGDRNDRFLGALGPFLDEVLAA
jgi:pimeloyl-ACP methyl ester carboxylesterase